MGEVTKFLKEYWKQLLLVLAIILVLLFILYLIMAGIAYIITWYGAFALLFIVLFISARKIAKFLVFPAHCSFFKRGLEWRLAKNMASKVIGQLLEQRYALDIMTVSIIDFEKI